MMWADFSDWLVTAGVVVGYVTILVTLIEVFGPRSAGLRRPTWPYAIGNIVTLILATLNMLVHTRDAWTSVVPWGLVLSATTVVVALVTGWVTRETMPFTARRSRPDATTTFLPALRPRRCAGGGLLIHTSADGPRR